MAQTVQSLPPSLDGDRNKTAEGEEVIEAQQTDNTALMKEMEAYGLPTSFSSTKGKRVEGNVGTIAVISVQPQYRQYLNLKPRSGVKRRKGKRQTDRSVAEKK